MILGRMSLKIDIAGRKRSKQRSIRSFPQPVLSADNEREEGLCGGSDTIDTRCYRPRRPVERKQAKDDCKLRLGSVSRSPKMLNHLLGVCSSSKTLTTLDAASADRPSKGLAILRLELTVTLRGGTGGFSLTLSLSNSHLASIERM